MGYLLRRLQLAAIFAAFFIATTNSPALAGDLAMHVLDVGQGDSILLRLPDGKSMLVDAGPSAAGQTVVEYLNRLGVERIDILAISHPHEDHLGGALAVLDAFPVGKVWDSGYVHGSKLQQRYLQTIKDKGIRFGKPKAGFVEVMGGARVEVLAPVHPLSGTNSDANNNGLILRVTYGDVSFLLMGDAEGEERATVGTFPRSTVLKVSHHGSHNGTDPAFLAQVRPQVAVISYGLGNSYGHPHAQTVKALEAAKVRWYSTTGGPVVITTDGKTFSVKGGKGAGVSGAAPAATVGNSGGASSPRPATSTSGGYIGNRNSHVFHLATCSSLPAPKNQVPFSTRDEALQAGYRPCKRCNP